MDEQMKRQRGGWADRQRWIDGLMRETERQGENDKGPDEKEQ